ncbi:polysaccharide biosynthesis protein [Actinoplanes sp. N902-109]|uniref:polysaccharide biosynthesis protein n=1 Tax=Actinoplanes sp. (strain N902-109) TaxID=649831 RepID=UPI00032966F4|nr:polysaccharide biosynthesis protein [Actinoplanes sp. N902-109]AGL14306.1 polysaccharide biosynthesis protein [Actinoplanes sp. N902-109]
MTIPSGRLAGLLAAGAAPIAVAVAVQSAGNLAFHAVVGRLLDPDAYGALGAVLSAMVMLGVPLGALQTAASALAAAQGPGWPAARRTLRSVAVWSVPPAGLVLAGAPLLRDYFHLGSLAESVQLGPYLVVAAVTAAARGLLLGDRKVGAVATTYFAGTAIRLVLGVALALTLGVSGALAATVLGELASLLIAMHTLRRSSAQGGGSALQLRAVGHAGLAVTGLFLFSTVDLLLARHHLRDGSSGAYVAAATIAKTVLALPAGIMSAVFPRLLAGWSRPGRGRVLLTGAAAVAGPALLGGLLIVALPALVLRILYGDGYTDATGLVRTLATVAALTSVVTVLTNAALARRSWTIAVPWGGAVLEVALIEMFHASATQIAACSVAALVPILLLMVLLEARAWRPVPARRHPAATAA